MRGIWTKFGQRQTRGTTGQQSRIKKIFGVATCPSMVHSGIYLMTEYNQDVVNVLDNVRRLPYLIYDILTFTKKRKSSSDDRMRLPETEKNNDKIRYPIDTQR